MAAMPRADFAFLHRFRVRYAEVDPQSVVFNSRYLEYADLVLTDFWRSLGVGVPGGEMLDIQVRRATLDYLKPIRADEEIDGLIRVARIGTSSIVHLVELHGADAEDLRAVIEMVHVHVDLERGVSSPVPERLKARLLGARETLARS